MSISLVKGFYHCFGCGLSGDMIDFVAKIEGVNRLKAHVVASKITDLSTKPNYIKKLSHLENGKDKEKSLKEAKFFFKSLPKLDWKRKPDSLYESGVRYMLERGYTHETLNAFGVKINPAGLYPIVIPVYEQGKFCGYIMRRVDGEEPKYLHNSGFSKKNVLAGRLRGGIVFVVEGVMDLMMAWQYGVKNVCALSGWKASQEQIAKIAKFSNKVVCGLDNTPTGEKGYELLKGHFYVRRFLFPFETKDIGEMSEHKFKKSWKDTIK